jgi:hypothetical protein
MRFDILRAKPVRCGFAAQLPLAAGHISERDRMRKFLRILVIGCSILAVAGCSLATVAYNNGATVLSYALDDYFDLNRSQQDWLKPRLERFIDWHRGSELPVYRQMVNEAMHQVASGARVEDARRLYAGGRNRVELAAEFALPDMAAFLLQLEPRQIAYLENKLLADHRKLLDEMQVPAAKRQQRRVERLQERFEDWMGPLNRSQQAKIQAALGTSPAINMDALRLADRQRRQGEFIGLLKAPKDAATMQRELRRMLFHAEQGRDPAYQAELNRQFDEGLDLLAAVLAEASSEQTQRVQKRLGGYAEDIRSLLRSS